MSHQSRIRSHPRRPGSSGHKPPVNSLADDFHEELQAGLEDIKSSLSQEIKDRIDRGFDKVEQKLTLIEQQLSSIKSEVSRDGEKSSDLVRSQRDMERSIAQMTEAIRSFQLIMVLSGTKNANDVLKHEVLTGLKSASNPKDSTSSNLLGS